MKRMLLSVVALALACAPGPQGPPGLQGPPGPQGPPGVTGPGGGPLVWKDATARVVAYSDPPRAFDDTRGDWWFIDPEMAQVDLAKHRVGPATSDAVILYDGDGCSGRAYFAPPSVSFTWPHPRVPFLYRNDPVFKVRLDNAVLVSAVMRSSWTAPGGCAPYPPEAWVVLPVDGVTTTVGPPDLRAVPPLRPGVP